MTNKTAVCAIAASVLVVTASLSPPAFAQSGATSSGQTKNMISASAAYRAGLRHGIALRSAYVRGYIDGTRMVVSRPRRIPSIQPFGPPDILPTIHRATALQIMTSRLAAPLHTRACTRPPKSRTSRLAMPPHRQSPNIRRRRIAIAWRAIDPSTQHPEPFWPMTATVTSVSNNSQPRPLLGRGLPPQGNHSSACAHLRVVPCRLSKAVNVRCWPKLGSSLRRSDMSGVRGKPEGAGARSKRRD